MPITTIRNIILVACLAVLAIGCKDREESTPTPAPKPIDHTPHLLRELSVTQGEVMTLTSVNSTLGVSIVILSAALAISLTYHLRRGGSG